MGSNVVDNVLDLRRHHQQQHVTFSSSIMWSPEMIVGKDAQDDDATLAYSGGGDGLRGSASLPRLLGEARRSSDGTLAVLMIVCALFCFIWYVYNMT